MKKLFLLGMTGVATLASAGIVNGDFESGNTGFSTNLTYSPLDYTPPSIYDVGTDPNAHHSSWASFGDHTSGQGNMLIVNGSTDQSLPIVWEGTTSNLSAGTYEFSFYLANTFSGSEGVLDAYSDGALIGSGFAATGLGTWIRFSANFTTSGGVSTLKLVNSQLSFGGNDFAVDDIAVSTQAVPEPMTLIALVLGATGAIRRNRRS